MTILDSIRNGMRTWLGVHDPDYDEFKERQEVVALQRDYRLGNQRRTLKVKYGQPDDNIFVNFTGLLVDRSVSGLFGNGITFQLPGGVTETTVKGKKVSKKSKEHEYIEIPVPPNPCMPGNLAHDHPFGFPALGNCG